MKKPLNIQGLLVFYSTLLFAKPCIYRYGSSATIIKTGLLSLVF